MLVLSRNVGESIRIGDNTEIIALKSSRGRMSIGVRAPSDVRVVRSELEFKRTKKSLEVVMSQKCVAPLFESKEELTAELKRVVARGRQIVAVLDYIDTLEQIDGTEPETVELLDGALDELEASQ